MQHVGPISGIAAHAGRLVATAGYDNQVILWAVEGKRPLARAFHDHLANQCSFSPDGRFLASAGSDYSARLWRLPELRLETAFTGHGDDVEMVAFSPEGARLATCSRDGTLRVFDLAGRLQARMAGHAADVISVAWSEDGRSLISSSDDGTVRRWEAATGTQLQVHDFGGVETDTLAIAGLDRIYAGDDEGRISIIRGGGNAQAVERVPAHRAGIKRLVHDPAGGRIASLSYDRTLAVWAISEEGGLTRRHESEFPSPVWPRSGAFLDRDRLVFGTFGSTFALYDMARDAWDLDQVRPDLSINAVARDARGRCYTVGDAGIVYRDGRPLSELGSLCNFLQPFGTALLTGGQLGCVFDGFSGDLLHRHRSPLNCAAVFTRGGQPMAMVGAYTGEGLVFRLDGQGRPVFVEAVQLHDNAVKGLAANAEGVFSVCASGAAALHGRDDLALVWRRDDAHGRIANACAAVGETDFASVSRDLKLRLWHGAEAEVIETPHRNSIKCAAASDDGRLIATGSYTGYIAVYDRAARDWCSVTRPTAAGISAITALPGSGGFLASAYDASVHTVGLARMAAE